MSVYLSVGVAGISSTVAASLVAYRLLRPKFPVTVNCWYCNQNTKVPYGNKNCWDCPHCEQYNGFNEAGGYNKPIPAQHEEFFNEPLNQNRSREYIDNSNSFKNGFCSECNENQQRKITGLSNFVPLNEENYNEELSEFKTYLEKVYRLCRKCELVLQDSLAQQDSFLRPKLLEWRSRRNSTSSPTKSSIFETAFIKKVYSSSTMSSYFYLLSFVVFLLTTVFDVFKSELVKFNLNQEWKQIVIPPHILDDAIRLFNQLGYQISLIACVVAMICKKLNIHFVDFVTLLMHLTLVILNSHLAIYCDYYLSYYTNKKYVNDCILYSTLILLLYSSISCWYPKKLQKYITKSSIASKSRDTSTNAWIQNKMKFEKQQQRRKKTKGSLQTSLGAMSLGSPKKPNRSSGVFTTHEYVPSSPTPSLNYISDDLRSRRPILSPPRLASPQPYNTWHFTNYWQQPQTIWSPSINGRMTSSPNYNSYSQFQENGHLYSSLPSNNSYYCPSYPSSRVGSVYGCDEPPFYDHQCHNFNFVSQQEVNQSYESNLNRKRGSEKGTNSSKSSTSTCPVDTTSNINSSENGKETCYYSWQYLFLVFSILLNMVAAISVLKDTKLKFPAV